MSNTISIYSFAKKLSEMRLDKNEIAVLLAMLCFYNRERNDCYASQETIAKKAGYKDTTTVKRAISSMKRKGIIEVHPPKRSSHSSEAQERSEHKTNTYFFPFLKDCGGQICTHQEGENAPLKGGKKTPQTINTFNNNNLTYKKPQPKKKTVYHDPSFDFDELFDLSVARGDSFGENNHNSTHTDVLN